jgi:UDP-N-acetylglucosamine 2-epimerase (non-hydrolysing)
LCLFLGDSNSALASIPLFKEGYRIGHIEGGMRSYDRRMPEETNRVLCDYCSDLVFVYTPLYKERLLKENKPADQVFVVGNTITEIVREFTPKGEKKGGFLVADIHRNENLKTKAQYEYILDYLNEVGEKLEKPIKLVKFNRALKLMEGEEAIRRKWVEPVGPYGFLDYLRLQYDADGVVSDSGTSQEECPLLRTPVVVPRNFTERPESVENGNSILVGEHRPINRMVNETVNFFKNYHWTPESVEWLGDGTTATTIRKLLQENL